MSNFETGLSPMPYDRATASLIVEKLDRGYISLSDARAFLETNYRVKLSALTKEKFIRDMFRHIAVKES